MRRVIAFSLLIAILASGCALGASHKSSTPAKTYTARDIPADPLLPAYTNPQEVDISKGKMHISFKGVFRGADDSGTPVDRVYFAFTATPESDMYLAVKPSEMYDSKGRSYQYHAVPDIGGVKSFERELIAGITVPVLVGVNMPLEDTEELVSVSRITITFNDEAFQFRNIVIEDWETWQDLRAAL